MKHGLGGMSSRTQDAEDLESRADANYRKNYSHV